jgi:hypothetical protein
MRGPVCLFRYRKSAPMSQVSSTKSGSQPQNLVFRLAPGQHAALVSIAQRVRRDRGENCSLSDIGRAALAAIIDKPELIGLEVTR